MLRAHRQAWCWQDEYYGLTMADIRKLERETQLALQEKMNENLAGESIIIPVSLGFTNRYLLTYGTFSYIIVIFIDNNNNNSNNDNRSIYKALCIQVI